MKQIIATLAFATVLLTGTTAVSAASPKQIGHIYYRSNASFIGIRNKRPSGYDWKTNECSVPKEVKIAAPTMRIASWVFSNQCVQHDFAYRNYNNTTDTGWWRRLSVDLWFLKVMQDRCNTWWVKITGPGKTACDVHAGAFFGAVRAFAHF